MLWYNDTFNSKILSHRCLIVLQVLQQIQIKVYRQINERVAFILLFLFNFMDIWLNFTFKKWKPSLITDGLVDTT
jgi:hypothetical protein